MDDTGIFNLKNKFSINIPYPQFLPIPVLLAEENKYIKEHEIEPAILKLTYIGRSVNWKMMPLKKILKDCAKLANLYQIHFTILVDNIDDFHKLINLTSLGDVNGLTINLVENMPPSEINGFLMSCSDLHFAMGTAALEAAKLGIPTILVDYSTNEFEDNYQYRWLFETEHFNLGKNIEKAPLTKGISMKTLLSSVESNSSLFESSKKSFEYVATHHDGNNVVRKLIAVSKESQFKIITNND